MKFHLLLLPLQRFPLIYFHFTPLMSLLSCFSVFLCLSLWYFGILRRLPCFPLSLKEKETDSVEGDESESKRGKRCNSDEKANGTSLSLLFSSSSSLSYLSSHAFTFLASSLPVSLFFCICLNLRKDIRFSLLFPLSSPVSVCLSCFSFAVSLILFFFIDSIVSLCPDAVRRNSQDYKKNSGKKNCWLSNSRNDDHV